LDPEELPDDFWQSDECRLVTFNETFIFNASTVNDPVGDSSDNVGSRFFFEEQIMDKDGHTVPDVVLSGVCTRTKGIGLIGIDGAGTCEFVWTDLQGRWSITAQGYLESASRLDTSGKLAVTGGSGYMISIVGEMNILPFGSNGELWEFDPFEGPTGYKADAAYGLIICPEPHPIPDYY